MIFDESFFIILSLLLGALALWYFINKVFKNITLFNAAYVYFVINLLSCIFFFEFSQFRWYAFEPGDINWEPLLYYCILYIVLITPFLFVKINRIDGINDTMLLPIFKFLSIYLFVFSIFPFLQSIIDLQSINTKTIVESYEGKSTGKWFITDISIKFRSYFSLIIAPLFFYFLYKGSKFLVYQKLLLFVTASIFFGNIVSGARGTLINNANYYVFCFIICKNILPKPELKKTIAYIKRASIIILLGMSFITIARFGSNKTTATLDLATSVSLYAGQGPLEFSRQMFPSTVRTEGDNNFSFIKIATGHKSFKENDDRRAYWEKKQDIQNFIFYTLIGDIYSDLGYYYTILFLIITSITISYFCIKNFQKKRITVQSLILLSLYYEWVTMGTMCNCYKTYYLQFFIFTTLCIVIFLNFYQKRQNG